MSPHMQALTLVEHALGNWSRTAVHKVVPAVEHITQTQLNDLAALAETDYRRAEHMAQGLLEEVRS